MDRPLIQPQGRGCEAIASFGGFTGGYTVATGRDAMAYAIAEDTVIPWRE